MRRFPNLLYILAVIALVLLILWLLGLGVHIGSGPNTCC